MAEYEQKTEDKIEDKIVLNDENDSILSLRELFFSVFNKRKVCFESENNMQTSQERVIISEVDEKILEETGIARSITPLVVDTDIADSIDDSFIKELKSVSVNLKTLLEKAREANGLVAQTVGNANKSMEMNAVEGKGKMRVESNSRWTELKNLLPEVSSSVPCQTKNDILLEVINYIKWLQTECGQSQEIHNQLKRIFVDLIKSAVTLKRLKYLTKATVDKKTPMVNRKPQHIGMNDI